MPTLILKELGVAITQRKIVVFRADRNDLPHLTISWNNPSGEVDIHLTPAVPTSADDRQSILKVKETDFNAFCETFARDLFNTIKSTMPPLRVVWNVKRSWLAKHRYYLLSPNTPLEDWIRQATPKIKSKRYRLDVAALANLPKHQLRLPSRRSWTAVEKAGQFFAICKQGRQKGTVLMGMPWTWPDGSVTWNAFDWQDAEAVMTQIQRLMSQRFHRLASKEKSIIYRALKLREIGW